MITKNSHKRSNLTMSLGAALIFALMLYCSNYVKESKPSGKSSIGSGTDTTSLEELQAVGNRIGVDMPPDVHILGYKKLVFVDRVEYLKIEFDRVHLEKFLSSPSFADATMDSKRPQIVIGKRAEWWNPGDSWNFLSTSRTNEATGEVIGLLVDLSRADRVLAFVTAMRFAP